MRLHSQGIAHDVRQPVLGKLTSIPIADVQARRDYVIYRRSEQPDRFQQDADGYAAVLMPTAGQSRSLPLPTVEGVSGLDYLEDGDVVYLRPGGAVNVLYRRSSCHNTVLLTERCNSRCLMCSQPPRIIDDSYRNELILRLIDLIDPATREIILSGGEPTLLNDGFLDIVEKFGRALPQTTLLVLTNGRRFNNPTLARNLAAIKHPDLILGVPLYSDLDTVHDKVVQAPGAYYETIDGLYNLAERGARIQLRMVLTQQTYRRLPQWADFVYRNLTFVEHVALMGLEFTGLARSNWRNVWVEPSDYGPQLEEATLSLVLRGVNVSVFNHQLCTLPRAVWPYAAKSISDWKNVYAEDCSGCGARLFCGGFFESCVTHARARTVPLPPLSPEAASALRAITQDEEGSSNYVGLQAGARLPCKQHPDYVKCCALPWPLVRPDSVGHPSNGDSASC